jgi:CheY-like chemotaxis protein
MSSTKARMPTILLVEDESTIRAVVSGERAAVGYEVIVDADADEAIVLLAEREDIVLVFTDVNMPGSMDGLELAAAVRHRWPPIHIIITSGKARPRSIPINALFIPKPYVVNSLVSAMRTFANTV